MNTSSSTPISQTTLFLVGLIVISGVSIGGVILSQYTREDSKSPLEREVSLSESQQNSGQSSKQISKQISKESAAGLKRLNQRRADQRQVEEKLATEAKRAWRELSHLNLTSFTHTSGQRRPPTEERGLGLIGAPFSHWERAATRAGFEVIANAPLPTLKQDRLRVTLRVREGFVLGARVTFSDDTGGPEWAQVVGLLAGSSALGGENDPMMALDHIQNPPPAPLDSLYPDQTSKTELSSTPSALGGSWGEGARRVSYHLELNERGSPRAARLWFSPASLSPASLVESSESRP